MSFFPAPPVVQAEVFTRLPDHLRTPSRHYWDTNAQGHEIESLLEGPSFDRAGNLYTVDVSNGRVYRINPAGQWRVLTQYDGAPNGLKVHRDGRIFIADHHNGIVTLDPDNGKITPLLRRGAEGFKGVNDLFFAANGDLYFTDQGQTGLQDASGRIFRYSREGKLSCVLDNIPSPNGLVVNPQGSILYVAVTRANQIWRVPLHDSGMPLKVSVFSHLHGGPAGPDGLALDTAGNLYVAHAGVGIVWQLSPLAQPLLHIQTPTGLVPTNLAFGGADNRTLYITEAASGTILRVTVPVAGEAMYSHQR